MSFKSFGKSLVKVLNHRGNLLYGEYLHPLVHLLHEVLDVSAQVRDPRLLDSGRDVLPKLLADGFRLWRKTGSVLTCGGS